MYYVTPHARLLTYQICKDIFQTHRLTRNPLQSFSGVIGLSLI
jgi:hypothetical protein